MIRIEIDVLTIESKNLFGIWSIDELIFPWVLLSYFNWVQGFKGREDNLGPRRDLKYYAIGNLWTEQTCSENQVADSHLVFPQSRGDGNVHTKYSL